MHQVRSTKGPWTHRALTHAFTLLLTVLAYWLLGFVINDIGTWPGPDYFELEKQRLDPALVEEERQIAAQIADVGRQIDALKNRQAILRDSVASSQQTMNQLLAIQRLAVEKGGTPSEQEQQTLAETTQFFLDNQRQFQTLNDEVSQQSEQLRTLQDQQRALHDRLEQLRQPIRDEFQELLHRHALQLGALKLGVLLPVLIVAVSLFLRYRGGAYAPLVYAFGIAVAAKTLQVMHMYFPARYFKYMLIVAALAIVLRILIYLLRMTAFPKHDWLMKQYREAYETFFCPVCDFPIRRGPLKYLFWSRRSLKKKPFPPHADTAADEPYSCPMCGTRLFEECDHCHNIRPSLLPACDKCGATHPVCLPDAVDDQPSAAAPTTPPPEAPPTA